MRRRSSLLLAAVFVIPFVASSALAQERHDQRGDRRSPQIARPHRVTRTHQPERWHGDIHRFHERDFPIWRSGHWRRDVHEGRNGWWWIVGGSWYFYPTPVYPYPDPFVPTGVVVETMPSGTSAHYYCSDPEGYYPYVTYCQTQWQPVVTQTVVVPPPQPESPRDVDYRQLNTFADEFYHIDFKSPSASAKLKNLDRRVEAFRKALLDRDYNALDVVRDAEDLRGRIAGQRAAVAKGRGANPSLPPGSEVVFPH